MWIRHSATAHVARVPKHRYPGLGQRIRDALGRSDSVKNPHQLANKLGVAYTTILAWLEETSVPGTHNAERLADAIGVTRDWLLYGEASRVERTDSYPSLTDFLKSQQLNEDERRHLESQWFGFGDPGPDYWPMALHSYRMAKRAKKLEPEGENLAKSSDRFRPVKKRP